MTRRAALAAAASPAPVVTGAPARARVVSPYRFSWRGLPKEVKLMAVGLVVVLVLGMAWLFVVPYRPDPIVPLLGWSEPTSPRKPGPTPKPSPRGAKQPVPEKKGWLPW